MKYVVYPVTDGFKLTTLDNYTSYVMDPRAVTHFKNDPPYNWTYQQVVDYAKRNLSIWPEHIVPCPY